MKVNFGPHLTWWGPYQIMDLLQHVGVSEDRCHDMGKWLSETWVGDFLQAIHDKRKRRMKVRIDYYDIWSMDHTLAPIIHPMLVMLKEKKQGYGFIDHEDAPPELTGEPDPDYPYTSFDTKASERYEWVLDEMIFAFSTLVDADKDHGELTTDQWVKRELDKERSARIQNGFRLFGKYFQTLWD